MAKRRGLEIKNLEELFEQYRKDEIEAKLQKTRDILNSLKELYSDSIKDLVFNDNPLLKLVKKDEKP